MSQNVAVALLIYVHVGHEIGLFIWHLCPFLNLYIAFGLSIFNKYAVHAFEQIIYLPWATVPTDPCANISDFTPAVAVDEILNVNVRIWKISLNVKYVLCHLIVIIQKELDGGIIGIDFDFDFDFL